MGTTEGADFKLVLNCLKEFGLLLETDPKLPCVSRLVAGEAVRGSWWAHARSQQIFVALRQLTGHKDVLITKLISGKVTFVHRKLWPEILAVATAREEWQIKGLSPAARLLLKSVDQQCELRSDRLEWPARFKSVKPGQVARELEMRLLIHTEELHTESGAHAKQLEAWAHWARRIRLQKPVIEVADAKRRLEQRVSALNGRFGTSAVPLWIRIK